MTAPKVAAALAQAGADGRIVGRLPVTEHRTAPILSLPFEFKRRAAEGMSAEQIEAAKAAERKAHPLYVLTMPNTLSPEKRAEILAYLGERERVLLLPPSAVIEYIEADDYGPLVASVSFADACDRRLRAWERTLRPGRKRPGQWGWRARQKRHARRLAAEDRKVAEWQRRHRHARGLPFNRAARRLLGVYAPILAGRTTAAVP